MSVKFYDKGEHESGFVGFRASRAVDGNFENRQIYYPLSKHSFVDAHTLAHQQDKDWKLEDDRIKQQKRASANNTTDGPVQTNFESLAKIAILANEAGILSTQQLSVFLRCASQEGSLLYDIFKLRLDSAEYKRQYHSVRQLMLGSTRSKGLNLLTWGDRIYGNESTVVMTDKGYRLFSSIKRISE